MVEAYLDVLELGYFEVKEAFDGLTDEHVWKRPAGLLSVGELAGHVAYWEAVKLAYDGMHDPLPDLTLCAVTSPLVDHRFRYFTSNLEISPSEQHLAMTAQEVCSELLRVHQEAVARFRALNPDLDTSPPNWSAFWTYRQLLKYAAFHVSYHTGQMYTARHLLGEQTPDN